MESLVIEPDISVAVLGASGFLGSHLVDALLAAGCRVRALGRTFPGLLTEAALANPNLSHCTVALSEANDLEAGLDGVDVCFHLSSTTVPSTSNLDPRSDVVSNVLGSLNLLEAARSRGVRRIVFSSSGGTVYGIPRQVPIVEDHQTDPTCAYGISKLAIEKYLALYRHLHGIDSIVLRIANPYGERQRQVSAQGAVAVFLAKALRGETIEIWGDGSVVRDYIYVGEVARAMLATVSYHGQDKVFNIGSGKGLSLNQLVAAINRELGRAAAVNYRPGRGFDVPANVLDISRAEKELGWKPRVDFIEGLSRMRSSMMV